MNKLFIIFAILTISSNSELMFKIFGLKSGHFIEYKKDKKTDKDRGEDSFSTSVYGIAVADGVGGCLFSSNFVSQALVSGVVSFNSNQYLNLDDEIYRNSIHSSAVYGVEKLWDTQKQQLADYKAENPSNRFSEHDISTSSTFINTYIDNQPVQGPVLRVFQKGDSLMALFRKQLKPNGGGYYYKLIALPPDQQANFNQPYQFSTTSFEDQEYADQYKQEHAVYAFDIQKDDLVLVGSDGVFDNVPASVLELSVNFLIEVISFYVHHHIDFENLFNSFSKSLITKLASEIDALKNKIRKINGLNMPFEQDSISEDSSQSEFEIENSDSENEDMIYELDEEDNDYESSRNRDWMKKTRLNVNFDDSEGPEYGDEVENDDWMTKTIRLRHNVKILSDEDLEMIDNSNLSNEESEEGMNQEFEVKLDQDTHDEFESQKTVDQIYQDVKVNDKKPFAAKLEDKNKSQNEFMEKAQRPKTSRSRKSSKDNSVDHESENAMLAKDELLHSIKKISGGVGFVDQDEKPLKYQIGDNKINSHDVTMNQSTDEQEDQNEPKKIHDYNLRPRSERKLAYNDIDKKMDDDQSFKSNGSSDITQTQEDLLEESIKNQSHSMRNDSDSEDLMSVEYSKEKLEMEESLRTLSNLFLNELTAYDIIEQNESAEIGAEILSDAASSFNAKYFSFRDHELNEFKRKFEPKSFSTAIAFFTKTLSQVTKDYPSNFWLKAVKFLGEEAMHWTTGKVDDITVVAGLVIDQPAADQNDIESLKNESIQDLNRNYYESSYALDFFLNYKKSSLIRKATKEKLWSQFLANDSEGLTGPNELIEEFEKYYYENYVYDSAINSDVYE